MGSIWDDSRLRAARSYTFSPDSPFSLISSFTQSIHLFFGLPLLLLPCTYIPIALFPTYFSSLLITFSFIQQFHLCALHLLLMRLPHRPRLRSVHHCWSYYRLVYLALDRDFHSSGTQHSRHFLPVPSPALNPMVDLCVNFSILRQCRSQIPECLHSCHLLVL